MGVPVVVLCTIKSTGPATRHGPICSTIWRGSTIRECVVELRGVIGSFQTYSIRPWKRGKAHSTLAFRSLMGWLRQLVKVELVALASLAVAAVVLATVAAFQASLHPSSFFTIADSFKVVFGYTIAIGCVPVIVFGAPLYTALLHSEQASWSTAFAIGAFPGVVLLFFSIYLALWSLASGVVVALATHAFCVPGSNQSSKRTR